MTYTDSLSGDDTQGISPDARDQAADPSAAVAMDGKTVVSRDPATEIEQYRAFVQKVAKARNGKPIFNRSEAHAAIVVEYLFKSAAREVNILTERLHVPVYGSAELIAAATDFLSGSPDARLNIISEAAIPDDHPLIRGLLDAGYGQKISRRVMTPADAQGTPYHFSVADGSCFRFEPDKSVMAAVVKFGDESFGKQLTNTFKEITRKVA
jgi:hypothetical protein